MRWTAQRRATVSAPHRDDAAALALLVAEATHATHALVDERYTLTAVVVERQSGDANQTIVVEFIDHGPTAGDTRWAVSAYDELTEQSTNLGTGASASEAVAVTAWSLLDR